MASSLLLLLVPNTLAPDRDAARAILRRAPDSLDRVRNPPPEVVAMQSSVRARLAPHRIDDGRSAQSRIVWRVWWLGNEHHPLGSGARDWARAVCFADEVDGPTLDAALAIAGPRDEIIGLDGEGDARRRAMCELLDEHCDHLVVAITLKY